MSIEELKRGIKKLENEIFMNQMDDHWSAENYAFDRKKSAELKELRERLAEMEAENE